MILSSLRAIAMFPALFAIGGCGISQPEAVRPSPAGSKPVSVGSVADIPVPAPPELILSEDTCLSDADCVPAACCHAAACIGREKAKPCTLMCTQVCQPGTIDCGGACLCHHGRCAARLGNGGK